MKRITRFWMLPLFSLVLAGLLVACGDPTATPVPAKTAGVAMTTEAAMTHETPGAAMITGAAMAKPDSLLTGTFNNQGAEPVAGKAILGKTADGKIVLRFENLKSANGPDLYVYLTKDGSPSTGTQIKSGLELGKLKATEGNLNYELDSKLDVSQYKAVAIYCKSFSTIFGYANIAMQAT